MNELQNVLYVQTQGAMLHLDHDTVQVKVERETKLRVPLLRLSGIVAFGRVSISPFLIHRCAEDGRSLVWLTQHGRFRARVQGQTSGNVLLRRAQHLALSSDKQTCQIARQMVAAKIRNSRQVVLRAARDSGSINDEAALRQVAERLARLLTDTKDIDDLNELRGAEGEAARAYFDVFNIMIRVEDEAFVMNGRSRRPPRDRPNCVLSFLYALVRTECEAALEGAGLDPQVGYLHALRPGRPALALDLMEELRSVLADRITLTLINRRQLQAEHFEETPGGGFHLTDAGRKIVLVAYQERKQTVVEHQVLQRKVPFGLVPHIQARLLARHLRGDINHYPPFLYR